MGKEDGKGDKREKEMRRLYKLLPSSEFLMVPGGILEEVKPKG